ncbi:transposase [Caldicellulosiruptor bescii]|uniref:Transposase IS605 OrfB n=2 Tax=Caldicellulosiruptor bescii TaxID=31899 RepID=B9MNG7_CALBD|nr:zinc ribbon domain-containing protein [Caldicellulosiruptor bescii]ACM61498.1 transposase IS605 OrfB [Caldicellulosiruptor bescii DSM 6725]PBC88691.1 transposase [Caldicellulosiruptor bescii]PBC91828.1 transposase [Caldicellulosiruptor bescii]PBD02761.1 transposase [Caldicellulosiruptor bescii]PBD07623.1 transposase [Caldicellulosiruptor bescii]
MTKAEKIKQTRQQTKERRKNQIPVVYQLKINLSSVSKETKNKLSKLFLEAKWLYNYIVADIENRLNSNADKLKEVEIKVGENFERRKIENLSSQMKQALRERIKQNLYSLHVQKENGYRTGKLQFKHCVNSIPLKQYGNTFKFVNQQKTRVKIQGIKKPLRVLGGHQIPGDSEIAKAELVRRPSGIYLFVTCYIDRDKYTGAWKHRKNRKGVVKPRVWQTFATDSGIDFKPTGFMLSNGLKLEWQIKETRRLKKLQKQFSRQKKGSKRWYKTKEKIAKEYEKLTNIKYDVINKTCSFLYRYRKICFQDDNIKGWKNGHFSKSVHHSAVGTIKRRLSDSLRVSTAVVKSNVPTTKTCSRCGSQQEISLSDRIFRCSVCSLEIDRDLNAAINMLKEVGLGRSELTPVEWETAAKIFRGNPYILVSHTT